MGKVRANGFLPQSQNEGLIGPGNLAIWPRSCQAESPGNKLALLSGSNKMSAPGAKHA